MWVIRNASRLFYFDATTDFLLQKATSVYKCPFTALQIARLVHKLLEDKYTAPAPALGAKVVTTSAHVLPTKWRSENEEERSCVRWCYHIHLVQRRSGSLTVIVLVQAFWGGATMGQKEMIVGKVLILSISCCMRCLPSSRVISVTLVWLSIINNQMECYPLTCVSADHPSSNSVVSMSL